MTGDEVSVAAVQATLRSLLPVEALGSSSDLEQAVACCFCDGAPTSAAAAGCATARTECPKVGRCGHRRHSHAAPDAV